MIEKNIIALLLKAVDYKDNDKLVTLFTCEGELMTATMKGVKKTNAKLKFCAQPFSFCEYTFVERGGRYTIINALVIEDLFSITLDTEKYILGSLLCELCLKCVEYSPNAKIFISCLKALRMILYSHVNDYLIMVRFCQFLLYELGYGKIYIAERYSPTTKVKELLGIVSQTATDKICQLDYGENISIEALKYMLQILEEKTETEFKSKDMI